MISLGYELYHMRQKATGVYIFYCTTCVRGSSVYIYYCTTCVRARTLYICHNCFPTVGYP